MWDGSRKANKIFDEAKSYVTMPLIGIPDSITPELLFALAKMGHGDRIVIADANFPSDSVAKTTVLGTPIRVSGTTSDLLADILKIMPLDQYEDFPISVMDRVPADKERGLDVPAYGALANVAGKTAQELNYVERFAFYEKAKECFAVVQTTDRTLYANCIVSKGVL